MGGRDRRDQQLIRALNHPLRVEILRVLSEQVASPNIVSKVLRKPLGDVSYHMKVLLDCDCVEEVRQGQVRGATEHFYRAKPSSSLGSLNWQKIPPAVKRDLSSMSLDSFVVRVVSAVERGAFEEDNRSLFSWHPIAVDARGRQELHEFLEEVVAGFKVIADKSRRRLGEEDGFPLLVAVAAIEAQTEPEAD